MQLSGGDALRRFCCNNFRLTVFNRIWYHCLKGGGILYNEEVKRKFLEGVKNPKDKISFAGFFNAFAPFEQASSLDIAEMGEKDAAAAVRSTHIDEVATVRRYITGGKAYTNWCKDNNTFHNIPNGFCAISASSIDISDAIKQNFFSSEAELITSIQAVHGLDSGYADAPVLTLAWLGLTMKEVLALRDLDVDLEGRIIHLPDGNSISGFSDVIHDVLYRYSTCKISSRDKGNITQEVVKDMSIDSFIKRMVPRGSKFFGRPVSQGQINNLLNFLIDKIPESDTVRRHIFSNVWRSGRFYKLHQVEQSGVDVFDFRNRPVVEEVFRHKKNYHDTIKMYRWYKKAFSLK